MKTIQVYVSLLSCSILILAMGIAGTMLFRLSPSHIQGDMAEVVIQQEDVYWRISGHDMWCAELPAALGESQCTVTVENKVLLLVVHFRTPEKRSIASCEALYGAVRLPCRASFGYAGRGGSKVFLTVRESGIPVERLMELRQQDMISQFSDTVWTRLSLLVSGLLTGALLLCVWLVGNGRSSQRKFILLGSSLPLLLIFQIVFTLALLRMGYID